MPPYLQFLNDPWVESTLASLSPRQQMAQLLHVAGWSNRGKEHEKDLLHLIENYGIGGIIFFQGTPEQQLTLTHKYQTASSVPLLISMDAEWGLGMRLNDSLSFPQQIALGAIQNDQLIYDMGRDLGDQCRRLGVHMNFAPCVDVNVEPANPVIGFRSFGSDPDLVARKARAYMDGLQDAGILAVAKHFPGHGDTNVDSHLDLPVLSHSMDRLEQTELAPFRHLIKHGISAVMPGHLRVPSLDPTPNRGATLSYSIVTDLLRKHMGFKGLTVTDALDMKGVTKHFPPGEIELQAFKAGNDMLLFPSDVRVAILRLEKALDGGEIDLQDLESRCRHNLAAKRWCDLHQFEIPPLDGLHGALHQTLSTELIHKLHASSLSWSSRPVATEKIEEFVGFVNQIEGEDELKHHQLSKGLTEETPFLRELEKAGKVVQTITTGTEGSKSENPWVLSIHGLAVKAKDHFGMSEIARKALNQLIGQRPAAIVLFASPYAMLHLKGWHDIPVLHAFQGAELAQLSAAEVMLGNAEAPGRLSVDIPE